MKFHGKIHALAITAVTVSVIGGTALATGGVASAASYSTAASYGAKATPDAIIVYFCSGNLCAGWEGSASNPTIGMHSDEYNVYGHYEVQTPNHKTINTSDSNLGVGTNSNVYVSGTSGGTGQYCVTQWEYNGSGYDKTGYVCLDTS